MIKNLYKKEPLPEKIPQGMEEKIKEYSKSGDKRKFLDKSFDYLTKRYKVSRLRFLASWLSLNQTDVNTLWNKKGFIYCTQLNYLMRVMLVRSGLFTDNDIELKKSNTWYLFPHQYLKIRLSKKDSINVDPWAFYFGVKYEHFAHGFHAGRIF